MADLQNYSIRFDRIRTNRRILSARAAHTRTFLIWPTDLSPSLSIKRSNYWVYLIRCRNVITLKMAAINYEWNERESHRLFYFIFNFIF